MKERHKVVPASYLILRRDDEVLLAHRVNTGYFDNYYALPAGHVESGELPLDALLRESEEEIGISISREDVRLVHTMFRAKHDATGERADYFFEVRTWKGELRNMEPGKCDGIKWFPLAALPENLMPHNRIAFDCIQKGLNYSEVPYNEKFLNPSA